MKALGEKASARASGEETFIYKMKTKYLSTSEEDIRLAAEIIKSGGLVAFPTETVYGLGGNALDLKAAKKIYKAKGRPSDNPLIVHIGDIAELEEVAREVPGAARKLGKAFWPGPLSIVLPKKDKVPKETTGGLDTVAVRVPKSEAALELIRLSGLPIAGPSANVSGRPSPTQWRHVEHDLDGRIDACICGEPCEVGIESTIVDLTEPDKPQILRPGLISPEDIASVLKVPVAYDPAILEIPGENGRGLSGVSGEDLSAEGVKDLLEESENGLSPKAPGMKYRHYAPRAPLTIYHGEPGAVERTIKIRVALEEMGGKKVAVLFFEPEDPRSAARDFFAELRRLDEESPDLILAAALPDGGSIAFSVMNRMLKAAGYNLVEV